MRCRCMCLGVDSAGAELETVKWRKVKTKTKGSGPGVGPTKPSGARGGEGGTEEKDRARDIETRAHIYVVWMHVSAHGR